MSATAMTMIVGGWPLSAQEPGQAKVETKVKVGKAAPEVIRRVPYYFGQLGLSQAQKESIYEIQAKHLPRIEALEKQIEEVRAQSLKDCEAVLTEAQRKMLADRRAGAAEARSKRAARPRG